MRILFICSRNRLRSPTAERVFANIPGIEVSSAGTSPDADSRVTRDDIEWADLIFVMEPTHRKSLVRMFAQAMRDKRVINLDIPDDYEFMDTELVRLLRERVSRAVPEMG